MTVNYFGSKMKFTAKCHRPQPAAYSVEQWTNGVDKQIDTIEGEHGPEHRRRQPLLGQAAGGQVASRTE